VPYQESIQQLLHVLDDVRDSGVVQNLVDTLRTGGPDVHSYVVRCLEEQTPGLIVPALKYLSVHGQTGDVHPLLDAYFNSVSRRTLILNSIECMGPVGHSKLAARISEGGGDDALLHLEFRHAILAEVQLNTREFAQGEH